MKNMLRKLVFAVLIIGVPAVIFANVWCAFRYYEINRQIADLEKRQLELIERNKRFIAEISILRSPGRIIEEARELGMSMAGREQIIILEDDSSM